MRSGVLARGPSWALLKGNMHRVKATLGTVGAFLDVYRSMWAVWPPTGNAPIVLLVQHPTAQQKRAARKG